MEVSIHASGAPAHHRRLSLPFAAFTPDVNEATSSTPPFNETESASLHFYTYTLPDAIFTIVVTVYCESRLRRMVSLSTAKRI
jgi:hypothetical protein